MNIPASSLKAYGAFHDESHHPHCHFIVYSSNPSQECLYADSINRLKSEFSHEIFGQPMLDIMKEKALIRDELRESARKEIKKLSEALKIKGFSQTTELEARLINLAKKLPQRGKKVYQLLQNNLKSEVIEIVDLLAKEPDLSELYEKWEAYQAELNQFYREDVGLSKLSENESFRPVLNAVVKEAWLMRQWMDNNSTRSHVNHNSVTVG